MTPTDLRQPTASANGDLVNRVQQLRLDGQLGTATRGGGGSWLPWVLCALLALTWVGVGVRWYRTSAPKPEAGEPGAAANRPSSSGAAPAPTGDAAAVPAGELVLTLKGNLVPFLQINLSPIDVAGEVTEIRFKEGDKVAKDQILALIRDTRYRNEFNTAEAAYHATVQRKLDLLPDAVRVEEKAEMQAQIDEAQAVRIQAEQEYERTKAQRAAGAIGPQEVEKAYANWKTAEARVERVKKTNALLLAGARKEKVLAAEADVAAARARLDEADRLLKNCTVRAPIDGTILTKAADKGTLVSPMSFNVASGICTLADLSKLEVEVDVPERQITKVRPGPDCQIVADANPNRTYRGYVDRVMPIADDSKNVIKVRVRVILPKGEEPGSFLKPKMSVVVTAFNRDFAPQPNDQKWE
jgi:multidrug resistance efflux pump